MGCPCARARSNWRQSGHKNASLASSSSSFPSSFSRSSSSPFLLLLLPRAPAKIPPPLPLPPPREAPLPPGPALPFQAWTARRGARGAGRRVAARRCPLQGPPRPLAVGWLQKSREQRWWRRAGEDARGEPTSRVGSPKGWPRAPLPVQGKYPNPRQPAPGTAAQRPRPVKENWTCH